MFVRLSYVSALVAGISTALGATSFSDDIMNQLLSQGGQALAMSNAPYMTMSLSLNEQYSLTLPTEYGSLDNLRTSRHGTGSQSRKTTYIQEPLHDWLDSSIPTWAYSGSPSSNDIYDTAHRTPAAPRCNFPNVGCNCRNPDTGIGNPSPDFPVYYTYQKCNDNEVRVSLNLFYEKDGFIDVVEYGHD